jgi:hypothetical protein
MSRLQVRIVPEIELPAYHPGQMIRGRIIVRAKERISFSNLEVSLFCRPLEGDGGLINAQSGALDKSGEFSPERDSTYKFAFQVPAQPEQWENRQQFSWHLRVTASIPEDFDLDEELRIWVVAPGEERQLLQSSDEALQEPGTPGGAAKLHQRSRRPEPLPAKVKVNAGELVTVLLFSLLPIGFLMGGMVIALNGMADVKVPGVVRVFGLLAMLGSFFVLRKILEIKGAENAFRVMNGVLATMVGLLGCHITLINPDFSWLHLQFEKGITNLLEFRIDWNFWMGFSAAVLFMPLAGYLFSGVRTKPDKLIFMSISAPLVIMGILSTVQLIHFLRSGAGESPSVELMLLAGLSLAGCIWALVKAEWRNAPFVFTCFSVLPMLLFALSAFGQGPMGMVMGAALMAAMGYMLYMGSRNLLAQRSLGKVTVVCDPQPAEVLLGNTQTVHVEFKPNSEVEIEYILVQWVCEETRSYTVGTERKSETSVIHQHRDHQARNQKLPKGNFFRTEHSFTFLPSLKPSSDTNPYISWRLDVKIVVKGKPDWDETVDLMVKR